MKLSLSATAWLCACVAFAPLATAARTSSNIALSANNSGPITLAITASPRIADPKLDGGAIPISYQIGPDGVAASVVVTIEQGANTVATVFSGNEIGAPAPITHAWNGKTSNGKYADPGDYTIRVVATADHAENQTASLSIVRLGFTALEALPVNVNEEFPMVYFMKGPSTYAFYATPSIHEYYNVKKPAEISDLDLDSGNPRPAVQLHEDAMSPPLSGTNYETYTYNYPYCYVMGRAPRLRATYGAACTSQAGSAAAPGYPVAGYEIRAVATDPNGAWISSNTNITPGGQATFDGPQLPSTVGKYDRTVTWTYEYRVAGGGSWSAVPGQTQTRHRFYTILGKPNFAIGASGTQYAGPWVYAADIISVWSNGLGIAPANDAGVVRAVIQGFFGQVGSVGSAISACHYDCPSQGGDGGASHYYDFGSVSIQLSRVFNFLGNGIYVNCSDVAGCTSAMCAMMGVRSVVMVRLGGMSLKAIWGIGTPAYTVDLWGPGSNSFSYHHIITHNGGSIVSDACMCVDEDGNGGATPGTPGWNVERQWDGPSGYMQLSAYNTVTKTYDPLPKLQ